MSNPSRLPGQRLKRYIVDRLKETQGAFAARIGISDQHLSGIITGRDKPSRDLSFLIEDETQGHVKARDWSEAA